MRDGDIISPRIDISEPLKNQCRHFVECVTNNRRPLTDGREALRVVQIMTAIEQSIAQSGAPIQIDGVEQQPVHGDVPSQPHSIRSTTWQPA